MLRVKRPKGAVTPPPIALSVAIRQGPAPRKARASPAICRIDPAALMGYDPPMGRDVSTTATVGTKTTAVRALLEHDAVILRGDLRQRLLRHQIMGWQAVGDDLHLSTQDGPVILHLGAKEATAWARALDKPAPSLAEKLGLGPATRLWLAAPVTDAILDAAVRDIPITPTPQNATLGLAVVTDPQDLTAVMAMMADHPGLAVWVANAKGPKAAVGDTAIRTALRAAGLIDTKTCAVSAALSATRYARRKG